MALDFYTDQSYLIAFNIDDTDEKSESDESENQKKEDLEQKDKISQKYSDREASFLLASESCFPEFYFNKMSVYLEFATPPPEYS